MAAYWLRFKRCTSTNLTTAGAVRTSHFRTAAVEPKQQAIQIITQNRRPDLPLLIETSEWWLYWPLQYLAHAYDDAKVELRSPDDLRPLDQQAFANMEAWIVEFSDSQAGWQLQCNLDRLDRERLKTVHATSNNGADQRPALDANPARGTN